MEKLKPCPFCGGEFTQVRYIGLSKDSAFKRGYRGECCDCFAITKACTDPAEAAAVWNARAERTCKNMQEHGFECSECDFFDAYADETRINYCPNCGAKVSSYDAIAAIAYKSELNAEGVAVLPADWDDDEREIAPTVGGLARPNCGAKVVE